MDNQQQNRNFKYRGHVLDKSCLQDIYNKYINGESLSQLSKFYGCDISAIKNFLKRNGVKIRNRKESMVKFHKTKTINIDQFLHESIIG